MFDLNFSLQKGTFNFPEGAGFNFILIFDLILWRF